MATMPLGKEYIKKLFKDGAAILGLKNAESFGAHSLRADFVTRLANGNGIGAPSDDTLHQCDCT